MENAVFIIIGFLGATLLVLSVMVYGFMAEIHFDREKRKQAKLFIRSLKAKKVTALNELLSDMGQVLLEQYNENAKCFTVGEHRLQLPDCNYWEKGTQIWISNGTWAFKLYDKDNKAIPDAVQFNYYDRLLIEKIVGLVRLQMDQTKLEIGIKKTV